MPGAGVGEQLRQQIAAGLGPVDQMMVRVDDRQIGLDDLFTAAVEPVQPPDLAEANAALSPDRRTEFRIGINVGDIVVEDGDIFGDGGSAWSDRDILRQDRLSKPYPIAGA